MRQSSIKTIAAGLLCAVALGASGAGAAELKWWVTEPSQPEAEKLVAAFEKQYPDIHVTLQADPYAGLEQKVLVALRSGNPPDVMELQTSWVPSYQATGKLRPLDDLLASTKLGKDFVPAALSQATVDGKVYGIPYQAEGLAMIYNKSAFKEVGLDPDKPPQTWTELLADAKKLTRTLPDGTQVFGYGIAGGGPGGQSNVVYRSLPYIWMNGGDIVSADQKSSPLNSPESVAAISFYTDMLLKEKVSPPSTLENDGLALRRLFQAGKIDMFQGSPTDYDLLKTQGTTFDFGVGITPHPDGKQTSALLGGWAWVAPSDGPNHDAANKLLAFLATTENIGAYTHTFPSLESAMSLPRFADPNLAAFRDELNHAKAQPALDSWVKMTDIYFKDVQSILVGDKTPQQAMDDAASQIGDLLN